MFDQRTVFILGAGASWHYGYPTGYELIEKILEKAELILSIPTKNSNGHNQNIPECFMTSAQRTIIGNIRYIETWENLHIPCKELLRRIKAADPLSIDLFLTKNPSVTKIAKILIGWILLECQNKYELSNYNPNRHPITPETTPLKKEDNWLKFIISKIINNEYVCNNKVDFITFNYDLSLEDKLKEVLENTETIDAINKEQFFQNRIHHVYGKIKKQPEFHNTNIDFKKDKDLNLGKIIDLAYNSSENLEIIAPKDNSILSEIRKKISNAQVVYILGYGFDDMNNNNLGLSKCLNHRVCDDVSRKVYFTNMEDKNILNKKTGKLFFNNITSFMPNESFIQTQSVNGFYYEKSIKSVYEALAEDFDL